MPGTTFQAFARGRDQRIERVARTSIGRAAKELIASTIRRLPVAGGDAAISSQRVEDARAGLAMDLSDMRDGRVGAQRGLDAGDVGDLVLAVRQDDSLAAEVIQNSDYAPAI